MISEIKFLNLDRLWSDIKEEVLDGLDSQYSTGIVRCGEITTQVEERLAKLTDRKYCVLYSTATDALTQGLRNLRLPDTHEFYINGSCKISSPEVLVPAYTFIASVSAIKLAGYKPVFVDVDSYYHLDLRHAEEMLTKKTKAMVYVDLLGCPGDQVVIQRWCKDRGITLIQDAAQCFGSEYNGHPGGSMGLFSVLSFSPTKPCPVFGSGGALVTDDDKVYQQALLGRLHGKVKNTDTTTQLGINSVMSTGEVHMLNVSLNKKDEWQKRRTEIAKAYLDVCGYNVPKSRGTPNWHKFVVNTNDRDKLKHILDYENIQSMIHYNPLPMEEPIFSSRTPAHLHRPHFSNALRLRERSLSLPICPYMTDGEVEKIVQCLKKFWS